MTDNPNRPQCGCCQPDPDLSTDNDWFPSKITLDAKEAREYASPIAIPNADNIVKNPNFEEMPPTPEIKTRHHKSQAHFYDYMCRTGHMRPDVRQVELFKLYNVDWFSVQYNPQGYLEVDMIVFQDGSDYQKGGFIDISTMRS